MGAVGLLFVARIVRQYRVLRVIDGDTFTTTGNQSVRLFEVDTPERREKCYGEATARLRELAGSEVRVELGPIPQILPLPNRYHFHLLQWRLEGWLFLSLVPGDCRW